MAQRIFRSTASGLARVRCRRPLAALLVLLVANGMPAAIPVATADSANAGLSTLCPKSLADFASNAIPGAMAEGKIPGAVFVVVQGDQVLFRKAYGLADVGNRRPVTVESTLFRVASISKILTAAAALDLVAAGRLDLHRDVNHYLSQVRVEPTFREPITLSALLTHSSGFDACRLGYAARTPAQKLSLRDYLARYQPARVRQPGLFSGYDNYGYALAGYLVQKASGIRFSRYVADRLFTPLKMNHSSFSPGPVMRKWLATGYWLDGEVRYAIRPDYVNITPAAGLCSTAVDMSRFLVALLANRRPDGSNAFPASVIAGLETQQFAFNPAVPGRSYGFDEVTVAGRRVLRQTGQWPGFNALLLLVPRQHCGIFLAYNLCDYFQMGSEVSRSFVREFIPAKPVRTRAVAAGAPSPPALKMLCGSYLSVRFPEKSPTLGAAREMEVARSPEGQLEIDGRPYHEIRPLVFERVSDTASDGRSPGQRVVFRLGHDGKVADLITGTGAFRRVGWSETIEGHVWLTGAASVVFLSVVVLWPMAFFLRLISLSAPATAAASFPDRRHAALSRIARIIAFGACALALWMEVSLALVGADLPPFAEFYGLPASVRHVLAVMPVLMALAAVLVVFCVVAWRRRLWSFGHRLHFSLVPVAFALFFYVFYLRHLLFVA